MLGCACVYIYVCVCVAYLQQGISEELVGKAIKKYSIPREKLVILTKCYFTVTDDPKGERLMPDQSNNRDYIMKKGIPPIPIFRIKSEACFFNVNL